MTNEPMSPDLLGDAHVPRPTLFRTLRRNRQAVAGSVVVIVFGLAAIFGPILAPYSINSQTGPVFGSPSSQHWLGLDDGGVDMVSLLILGTRTSMLVGVAATMVSVLIGGTIGVLAGYFGGILDSILARLMDYFIAVPVLPLMIAVAAVWGPSLTHIVIVIGLLLWTTTARVIRAQVLSVKQQLFVTRARVLGAGHLRIIRRHIVPQVLGLLIANVVLTVAVAIFFEAALSFLGLGDPNSISWGKIIENAFDRSAVSAGAWWAIVPPGLCIAVVVLCCSLVGGAVEDAVNPRLRTSHISRYGLVFGNALGDAGAARS